MKKLHNCNLFEGGKSRFYIYGCDWASIWQSDEVRLPWWSEQAVNA